MSEWLNWISGAVRETWQEIWTEEASPGTSPNHSSLGGPWTPSVPGGHPADVYVTWPADNTDLQPDKVTLLPQNDNTNTGLELVSMNLLIYVPPILIFLGVFWNALVFVVLRSRHFRNSPPSLLLIALSVADIMTLLIGLMPIWIGKLTDGHNEFRASRWGCRTHLYLTNTLRMFSVWVIALACLERACAMTFPLKSRMLFTKMRLICIVFGLFVVIFGVNIHLLWSTDFTGEGLPVNKNISLFCGIVGLIKENQAWRRVYFWYNFLVSFALPFIVIASCAAAVLLKHCGSVPTSLSAKFKPTASTSAMVMCLAVVCLVTTSPSDLLNMFFYYVGFTRGFQLAKLLVVCFDLWYHVGTVINFLLYCIAGKEFRHALSAVFCGTNARECNIDTISDKVEARMNNGFPHPINTTYQNQEEN